MNPELAWLKYLSEDRPQVILTDEKKNTDFNISYLDITVSAGELEEGYHGLRTTIKRLYPASPMIEKKLVTQTENAGILYSFLYKHNTLDESVYTLMWIYKLERKMLIGNFICLLDLHLDWRPLVLQMLASVVDITHVVPE